MNIYLDELQSMGLSKNQAELYSLLIRNGSLGGSELAKQAGISRQLTYKVIDELVEMGLCVKENKQGKVSRFEPTHPSQLADLLVNRQRDLDTAKKQLGAVIDNLVSDYNLEQGRPSVRFVEGPRGVEQSLMDTLHNTDEVIYTYVDPDLIVGKIEEIDDRYIAKRLKKGVQKKILYTNTPLSRTLVAKADDDLTERRIMSQTAIKPQFPVAVEIHNGQITYITYKNNLFTTTTISDESIYLMHRYIFESLWEKSKD